MDRIKIMKKVDDNIWINMLEDRSELAHDYDGTLAVDCVGKIVNQYILTFEAFREKANSI